MNIIDFSRQHHEIETLVNEFGEMGDPGSQPNLHRLVHQYLSLVSPEVYMDDWDDFWDSYEEYAEKHDLPLPRRLQLWEDTVNGLVD
jgi:hypothetical protein